MKTTYTFMIMALTILALTSFLPGAHNGDLEAIIKRLNTEVPADKGCKQAVFSLDGCTMNMAIECKGNTYTFYFDLNALKRVYTDKADLEDEYETLFFECKEGTNCIMSKSGLPAQPVFPVKLPHDAKSTLGKDAVKAFSAVIGSCK